MEVTVQLNHAADSPPENSLLFGLNLSLGEPQNQTGCFGRQKISPLWPQVTQVSA